jgi:hypothetical protein
MPKLALIAGALTILLVSLSTNPLHAQDVLPTTDINTTPGKPASFTDIGGGKLMFSASTPDTSLTLATPLQPSPS